MIVATSLPSKASESNTVKPSSPNLILVSPLTSVLVFFKPLIVIKADSSSVFLNTRLPSLNDQVPFGAAIPSNPPNVFDSVPVPLTTTLAKAFSSLRFSAVATALLYFTVTELLPILSTFVSLLKINFVESSIALLTEIVSCALRLIVTFSASSAAKTKVSPLPAVPSSPEKISTPETPAPILKVSLPSSDVLLPP